MCPTIHPVPCFTTVEVHSILPVLVQFYNYFVLLGQTLQPQQHNFCVCVVSKPLPEVKRGLKIIKKNCIFIQTTN